MKNIQASSPSSLPKHIVESIHKAREKSLKIVLVSGVFDVLHQEHVNFLNKAGKLGGLLLVAIESDARVKKIKGEDRPINNQEKRVKNLLELGISDTVFVLPDEFSRPSDHQQLIYEIKPDVLAVSSHTPHLKEKREILERVGGEVIVAYEQNPNVSSTKIINGKVS